MSTMTKWEYKMEYVQETVGSSRVRDVLNSKGEEGWEAVAVIPDCEGTLLVLKRPTDERTGGDRKSQGC